MLDVLLYSYFNCTIMPILYIDLYEDGTWLFSITRKLNAINEENLNHNCINNCFNENVLYRQTHSREGLHNNFILPMVLMATMLTYSHQAKLDITNCWVTMFHWGIKVINFALVLIRLEMGDCFFLCKHFSRLWPFDPCAVCLTWYVIAVSEHRISSLAYR